METESPTGMEAELSADVEAGPVVSTEWLAQRLGHPGVRVVDCRWYLRPFDQRNGDDEYARAHIPGAVHVRWDTDIADPDRPDLWMLAGPERFAAAMSVRGIGDDDFVVAYDDQHVTVAARLWWALRVYGHTAAAVLDGGMAKWAAEGRPLDDRVPAPAPARFTPRRDDRLYAAKQDVMAALDGGVRLVDGRMAAARAEDGGAIPGSIALPGIEMIGPDGVWPDPAEARARIAAAGGAVGQPTIAYCRGGVGACGTALAYAIAGQDDVAVYDGSWTEWITDPATPRALDDP